MLPRFASSIVSALLISHPGAVFAQSILCIEEKSIGFNWVNGQWVQQVYSLEKYLLSRSVDASDPSVEYCMSALASLYRSTEIFETTSDELGRWGCYEIKDFGQASGFHDMCFETLNSDGEILELDCGDAIVFNIIPDGEFLRSQNYSAGQLFWADKSEKDSITLSVGKCNRVG